MAGFDAAVGHGVGGAEARHDLCRREHAHAEISVRHLEQRLGEGLGGAEDRIERLREARHQSPLDASAWSARWRARQRPAPAAPAAAVFRNLRRFTLSVTYASPIPSPRRYIPLADARHNDRGLAMLAGGGFAGLNRTHADE